MEKYYKKNYIDVDKVNDIEFQIIEWHNQDESNGIDEDEDEDIPNCDKVYTMRCFGVTKEGISVTCQINNFTPFYYIKVADNFTQKKKDIFLEFIKNSYQISKTKIDNEYVSLKNCLLVEQCKLIEKKDLFGFRNNKTNRFIRLVFNNYVTLNKSKYIFKNPVIIPGINDKAVKYKLYESNFEPFMRFCHIKEVLMAGWIKLDKSKYKVINTMNAKTQLQVCINYKDIISLKDNKSIANFLQASWDIETYSYDGTFPDPVKKVNLDFPNVIYQIGTTFKYYNEKNTLVKHLLTLKKCADIKQKEGDPEIIIEECKNEKELIKRWIDLIANMDPDIMYTYNGDCFDCRYLIERAKLPHINLEHYLKTNLTRITDIPVSIKKEVFSSSAYGDSDFVRFYIPGRLNYDLLIHYKRGMKKYPSYKLDYISNEILKEGKNDVSPKDIFKYYEDGLPEQIKTIGLYCFIEGTRVSLSSSSVDIKCLENMNTDVITWVENKGFSTSQKVHFFNNGKRDCLELTLIDGTKIRCTNNHQFLTKNGWIEAQNLQSTDKILYYPEPAFTDYDTEKSYTFRFSDLVGTLDYNKSCIFLRLLGYLLTDGGISESTCYKNYSSGRVKYVYDIAYINLGTKADAINMQKDILSLIGKSPAIKKEKYTYRITLPMELSKWFLSLDGIEKGKRLDSPALLPNFILNENCPKWVLREFLKGLMGGDGHCPHFNKYDNKFGKVAFGQSKTHTNIDSLVNYMKDIQKIFEKFNINSTLSNVTKNATGKGYTVTLNIKQDDMITFYEQIGYAYCAGKSYKLAVVASYYKLKKETKRQFNWVCERVKVLRVNMSITKALKQAHLELKINEPIFNKHYSLPDIESINLNLTNPNDISASSCKFKKFYFPSAEDYLKLTESYERFVTDDATKSHSVKQDDTHTPCYYLSILHKKDIGKHNVYDIEVKDTHNFVANGAVVHNCIQDTELLQKLVDKQLILITIIQLANVTSVPIGFLTTRGQTIKVFSQLLRKARQMGYLVPHTNFNEDSDPLIIKTKSEHCLELDHIGEYITIKCGRNINSYGKPLVINGKLVEIVDNTTFIVKSSTLPEAFAPEQFTAKYTFDKLGHRDKQIINLSSCDDLIDSTFTGATVLTASPNFYQENIAVLDFASLYPTIMISRNLCYSAFIMDPKYLPKSDQTGIFIENGITYERIKWDDKVEYTMKHTCEGVGKSGKGEGKVCGKQAFFEISKRVELQFLKKEIENLEIECGSIEDQKEYKKFQTKIKTKNKELYNFENSMNLLNDSELDHPRYFCRIHDAIKNSRLPEEKYQKKDVSYDFTIVQPHTDKDGVKHNQGVLPALLEELYAERKTVKRGMAKAAADGDKLLEDILNQTQMAIKVSLNSCFGFLGRGQGNLILKELGSIVTSVGRTLIQQSKDYAENEFLNYIKEHNSLTQKIEYKQELINGINKNDHDIILEQFKIRDTTPKITEIEEIEEKPKKIRKKILNIN
jgi:DNA polymerase elongation subunit (family B)/intein/homing endonuclease